MKIAQFDFNDNRTFIVAELSANHGGKIDIAKATIKAAAIAGADAIKLQTYTADTITLDCNNAHFQIQQGTLWDGQTLYKLYQEAYMPWEWQGELKTYAESLGLICFSSPFDTSAVDFLESLDVPAYKVASFEITDIPLIAYIASKGKPVIISTGIATLEEIELAIATCKAAGNEKIMLLKCTSAYPAPLDEANLLSIPDMAKRFDLPIGFSDHTLGITAPITAVALGAKMIEKHFILERSIGGPDAAFSLDQEQFAKMVKAVRETEVLLGQPTYELTQKARTSRKFSRSLFVSADVRAGDTVNQDNVRSIRPGDGLAPKHYTEILGRRFNQNLSKGTPLQWDHLDTPLP